MTVYSGIFDSHAHYDDPKFAEDREEVISSLPSRGICGVINCGTNAETSRACLALADKYDFFYAAAGIHPEDITEDSAALLPQIAAMLKEPKTAALGEIGLDYHWTKDNKQAQKEIFASQLAMAVQLDKPVIIHDREAHEDVLELVRQYRPRGVLHSFSGSAELADEYIKLGMYIGIGGAVTFKNARKLPEVIARIPQDRFLLETDCPYSTPEPYRGQRNDSTYIPLIAERVAAIKNTDIKDVINTAKDNTCELFGINL